MYEREYSDTHTDLLGDRDIALDVYGGELPPQHWLRSTALPYAILGRHAITGKMGPVIAIWNWMIPPDFLKKCLNKIVEAHPEFEGLADKTVVVIKGEEPAYLSDYLKSKKGKKKVSNRTITAARDDLRVYLIGGKFYKKNEIADLVKARHSQSWRRKEIDSILCHPDMKKHIDLSMYIPSGCDTKNTPKDTIPRWSNWVRASGLSYENTLHFKDWLCN